MNTEQFHTSLRFEMEEQIMAVWNIANDINTISESIMDNPEDWSTDRISNVLIGVSIMCDVKSTKLFKLFETMIERGDIK